MNFSKTTSYAFSVLSFMAENEDMKYSAKDLNEALDIPWPYLRQLLTRLSKSGFIGSTRGRTGGFQLQKSTDLIMLADIVDAVEGLNKGGTCIMGFENCAFDHACAMHEVWEDTRESIHNVLKNTSLSQIKKKAV